MRHYNIYIDYCAYLSYKRDSISAARSDVKLNSEVTYLEEITEQKLKKPKINKTNNQTNKQTNTPTNKETNKQKQKTNRKRNQIAEFRQATVMYVVSCGLNLHMSKIDNGVSARQEILNC